MRETKNEKCVLCNRKTEYFLSTPINIRKFYIVGVGQLCIHCYVKTYCTEKKIELIESEDYFLSINK